MDDRGSSHAMDDPTGVADAGDAAAISERLESLRAEAVDRVTSTSTALSALVRERSSLNDDDEHDPDGAPLSTEWARLVGQVHAAHTELQQIESALLRVEKDTYGVCTTCGRPIPPIRLRVRPFAEQCLACAENRPRTAR